MAQQTGNDPTAVAASLGTKLQEFAAGLTREERAQLESAQLESGAEAVASSLQTKLKRTARALTPEESEFLRALSAQARAGAADQEDDSRGHMIKLEQLQPIPSGSGGGYLDAVGARFVRNVGWLVSTLSGH